MISVIVPIYNRANIVSRTIENILTQTYSDLELIIVDDGSNDNVEEVVRRFDDNRIKFIRIEVNRGACYARNVGVSVSKGEYIAFQDSDDLWSEDKLQHQKEYLEKEDADICICRMQQVYADGRKKEFHTSGFCSEDITLENQLAKNVLSTQLLFGKRDCFKNVMFDEKFPRFQDWDLGIRLIKEYNIVFLDEILVTRQLQNNSISNNYKTGYIAGKLLLEKYSKDFADYPKSEARFLNFYAQFQELCGESSRENLLKSLMQDFSRKTMMKYILQISGCYRKYLRWKVERNK